VKSRWITFALVVGLSFVVLGWVGVRIYQQAPPVPKEIATADGQFVVAGSDIEHRGLHWHPAM